MDLKDIAVHTVISLVAVLILSWLGVAWTFILIANVVFWPAREVIQHWPDYEEIFAHPQSFLEWACPVLTGFILYGVLP